MRNCYIIQQVRILLSPSYNLSSLGKIVRWKNANRVTISQQRWISHHVFSVVLSAKHPIASPLLVTVILANVTDFISRWRTMRCDCPPLRAMHTSSQSPAATGVLHPAADRHGGHHHGWVEQQPALHLLLRRQQHGGLGLPGQGRRRGALSQLAFGETKTTGPAKVQIARGYCIIP